MPRVYIAGCLACLFSVPAMAQQSDDLNFASGLEQFHNIRRMLPSYLNNIGLRMLGERKHRVEQLATIEDVDKRSLFTVLRTAKTGTSAVCLPESLTIRFRH